MVKVRGYRVEPREIEGILLRLPGVAQAVVIGQAPADASGTDRGRLIAHLVPSAGARLDIPQIQGELKERLPWYAIPHCLVRHGPLPLTEHGKTDRRALAAHTWQPATARPPVRTPPAEHPLLPLWNTVLGPSADPYSSFLANGGDSLAAGRLAAAMAARTGRRVRMADVLLAGSLDELEHTVLRRGQAQGPVTGRRHGPLTPAQQGLVLEEQLWGVEAAYAESCLFVLPRAVETGRLHAAVTGALGRHPAIGGRVEGTADPSGAVLRLGRTADVRTCALGTTTTDVTALADRLRRAPLDLETGPLGRARLIAAPEGCVALLLTLHHVVCDTWSLQLLLRDIEAAYAGTELPPAPPATACDYALAQTAAPSRAAVARRAASLTVGIPGSRREPSPPPSTQVSTLRTRLGAQTVTRIRATAARAGLTVFAVMCAAFESALATELRPGPFLYATPVAHRDDPAYEHVAGCLINLTPIASSVSSVPRDDPAHLLAAVGRQVVSALSASHLPYPDLVHALRLRGVHQPPHRFLFVHDAPLRLRLDGQEPTGTTLPPVVARSEVSLSVVESGDRFDVRLEVDAARVGTRTARSLLDTFEGSLRDPGGTTGSGYDVARPR